MQKHVSHSLLSSARQSTMVRNKNRLRSSYPMHVGAVIVAVQHNRTVHCRRVQRITLLVTGTSTAEWSRLKPKRGTTFSNVLLRLRAAERNEEQNKGHTSQAHFPLVHAEIINFCETFMPEFCFKHFLCLPHSISLNAFLILQSQDAP